MKPDLSSKSLKLHNKLKNEVFDNIFTQLDADGDNYISIDCSYRNLPAETLKVLVPILIELDKQTYPISRGQFVDACERLYKVLDPVDKSTLLNTFTLRRPESLELDPSKFTFSPSISKSSTVTTVSKNNSREKCIRR